MALLEVPRVVDLCLEGIEASRALDVGTGTGIFAEAFAARGLQAIGIDPNPGLLEAARREGVRKVVLSSSTAVYGDTDGRVPSRTVLTLDDRAQFRCQPRPQHDAAILTGLQGGHRDGRTADLQRLPREA